MGGTFDWKNFLLSPDGRITRFDYWVRYLLSYIVAYLVLAIIDFLLGLHMAGFGVLSSLFALVMLYSSIIVAIKRCHDRNKSGWWILLALIPIVGAIWMFIELGCLRGTVGANRFGPDPLSI